MSCHPNNASTDRLARQALTGLSILGLTISAHAMDATSGSALPNQAEKSGSRGPIVSFVSPGSLFPVEGTIFARRDGSLTGESYRPLSAYSQPKGNPIGEVRLVNPSCVTAPNGLGCEQGYAWFLNLNDGTRHRLAVVEYSYETSALPTYSPSVHDGPIFWSAIDYAGGVFWVATGGEDVIPFEKVAQVIDHFDTWCDSPERCGPVLPQMAEELIRIGRGEVKFATCYSQPYEIQGVISASANHLYHVSLPEIEPGSPEPRLPRSGFIPVRNKDGSHTGTFYSRGC